MQSLNGCESARSSLQAGSMRTLCQAQRRLLSVSLLWSTSAVVLVGAGAVATEPELDDPTKSLSEHSQRLSEPHTTDTSDDVNTTQQQQQQPALECVSVTCNEQLVTLEAWSEDAVRVTATPLGAPPPPAGYPSAMLPVPLQRLKGEEMRSRGEVRSSTRASNMHHVLCARTSMAMRMTASRPTSHSHGHA
jgi:hypothetical protein